MTDSPTKVLNQNKSDALCAAPVGETRQADWQRGVLVKDVPEGEKPYHGVVPPAGETQETGGPSRVRVPDGQTPLDDRLGHRYLDIIKEGSDARDSGAGSPYHGHSLEHCLHATGWVQRDLRIALDRALSAKEESRG